MRLTSFKIAITAMKRNKTRTFLTILGIVIGIAAVVAVMSAGQGIKGFVLKEIEMYGNDTIQTEIKVPSTGRNSTDNAAALATGVEVTTLTLEDEQAIRKLSNIKNTYAGSIGQQLVSYGSEKKQAMLYGVGPLFMNIDRTKLAAGRFFTEEEDRSLASVVVLGPKIKDKLFGPGNDFLEKWVKVGRQKFMVIGVMESRGASFGFDMDEMIYVPIQTLQKKIMGVDHVMYILSQVADPKLTDQTASEITDLLRERHNITDPTRDDFAVTPMTEAISMINTVFWGISLLLVAVAGISLVVGGVGIMNIMYVSVLERTYEIGLRKAIGAKRKDILSQFMWEAIFMTLIGAVVGVMLGVGISYLVSVVANSQGFAWQFVILPSSLILACGVATAIGIIFGVFPARTASKMDAVEALRYNK